MSAGFGVADSMDGVLNIDKGGGMTSHDAVARVRRILKTKRVGHAGTLDPDATGVLVIAVGQATRLLPFIPFEPKRYRARIAFGASTTTEDASGTILEQTDASGLTEADVRNVLPRFVGDIAQIPPMVSALHHEGRRLYELAREGITVERKPRPVVIHSLELSDFRADTSAEATLAVVCGGGTYIRTLCVDLGKAVGLPAHMKSLVRIAVGGFTLADALSLDIFEQRGADALLPMKRALPFPFVSVGDADAESIGRGQSIETSAEFAEETTVTLLHQERLIALACFKESKLCPFRVFRTELSD